MPEVEKYYRTPLYLSPSAYQTWKEDRVQYYNYYLSPQKRPREPQNQHMAIGSAFDAFVKAHMYKLYVNDNDPKYDFLKLFNDQVEEHNRALAIVDGQKVFDCYKASGALQDWSLKLNGAVGKVRFETSINGIVTGKRESVSKRIGSVPLSGKPDLYFTLSNHDRVISDWKVNGFYSDDGVSPKAGFVREYPGFGQHKLCRPEKRGPVTINSAKTLDLVDAKWAAQLAIYAWVLGEEVGSDFITMIHQIVCRPSGIRVAEHCCIIGEEFQHKLYEDLQDVWYRIQEGLIFEGMNAEQSLAYGKLIDETPVLTEEQLEILGPKRFY